jgi:hypothetical protein
MCQFILQDPCFYQFLHRIDQDHAASVRSHGCNLCGGPLHQANYERKPGGPYTAPEDTTRFSLCCGHCRRRCTPDSVRFLGRRVYRAAVVLLATALCSGLTLRRGQRLAQHLGVPVRTIQRWRKWWLTDFTKSAVWLELRGRFMPPVAAALLPVGLLERALGKDLHVIVAHVLQWISPLSTFTEGR